MPWGFAHTIVTLVFTNIASVILFLSPEARHAALIAVSRGVYMNSFAEFFIDAPAIQLPVESFVAIPVALPGDLPGISANVRPSFAPWPACAPADAPPSPVVVVQDQVYNGIFGYDRLNDFYASLLLVITSFLYLYTILAAVTQVNPLRFPWQVLRTLMEIRRRLQTPDLRKRALYHQHVLAVWRQQYAEANQDQIRTEELLYTSQAALESSHNLLTSSVHFLTTPNLTINSGELMAWEYAAVLAHVQTELLTVHTRLTSLQSRDARTNLTYMVSCVVIRYLRNKISGMLHELGVSTEEISQLKEEVISEKEKVTAAVSELAASKKRISEQNYKIHLGDQNVKWASMQQEKEEDAHKLTTEKLEETKEELSKAQDDFKTSRAQYKEALERLEAELTEAQDQYIDTLNKLTTLEDAYEKDKAAHASSSAQDKERLDKLELKLMEASGEAAVALKTLEASEAVSKEEQAAAEKRESILRGRLSVLRGRLERSDATIDMLKRELVEAQDQSQTEELQGALDKAQKKIAYQANELDGLGEVTEQQMAQHEAEKGNLVAEKAALQEELSRAQQKLVDDEAKYTAQTKEHVEYIAKLEKWQAKRHNEMLSGLQEQHVARLEELAASHVAELEELADSHDDEKAADIAVGIEAAVTERLEEAVFEKVQEAKRQSKVDSTTAIMEANGRVMLAEGKVHQLECDVQSAVDEAAALTKKLEWLEAELAAEKDGHTAAAEEAQQTTSAVEITDEVISQETSALPKAEESEPEAFKTTEIKPAESEPAEAKPVESKPTLSTNKPTRPESALASSRYATATRQHPSASQNTPSTAQSLPATKASGTTPAALKTGAEVTIIDYENFLLLTAEEKGFTLSQLKDNIKWLIRQVSSKRLKPGRKWRWDGKTGEKLNAFELAERMLPMAKTVCLTMEEASRLLELGEKKQYTLLRIWLRL